MIHRQKNIYIYKYLFWAKYPPSYAPDQEKKNLKFFYAPYGLKEYRCKVSTIYLYYYKSYYKLQETSEVLAFVQSFLKSHPLWVEDVRTFLFYISSEKWMFL